MAYYKPCKNCAVDKELCGTRQRMASAIKGHHVTSINFVCRDRTPMFRQGQRVAFRWRKYEPRDYDDAEMVNIVFHATVIEEKGTKFIVRVDGGKPVECEWEDVTAENTFRNSDRLVIKVLPADMWSINEPDPQICQHCACTPSDFSLCYHDEDDPYVCYPNCLKKKLDNA